MTIHNKDVEEFRQLWQKEFGEDLSPALAREYAEKLLNLYFGVARILMEKEGNFDLGMFPRLDE